MTATRDARLTAGHLSRSAIACIRQSSGMQVRNNVERRKLQCALEGHARALGFANVEVVDDDLGVSGGGVRRAGFERLVCSGNRKRTKGLLWKILARVPVDFPPVVKLFQRVLCPLHRSCRAGIPWTARIEFRLVRQHGTSDSDQPVGHAPESTGVTVAPGP